MEVYYDEARTYLKERLFPYEPSSPDQVGYIDFKANPQLISTSLEDFKHLDHWAAVQKFYLFLEWINGNDSHLETNDSALRGPHENKDLNSDLALAIEGRVFLFYRNLALNCSPKHSDWLCGKLMQMLHHTDKDFTKKEGVVGFTLNPVLHLAISKAIPLPDGRYSIATDDPGFGKHLMLSFWAYGADEAQVFQNLERLFGNVWTASKCLSAEIEAGS